MPQAPIVVGILFKVIAACIRAGVLVNAVEGGFYLDARLTGADCDRVFGPRLCWRRIRNALCSIREDFSRIGPVKCCVHFATDIPCSGAVR